MTSLCRDVVGFNDGHKPGSNGNVSKIYEYKNKNSSNFLSVFDNLLPDVWCERAYDYAVNVKKGKPWGVYITTQDALDVDNVNPENIWKNSAASNSSSSNDEKERAIGLLAVRALIFTKGKGAVGDDFINIHGTALWCLSSGITNSVEYHIDYAELYRYQTNTTVPPLYAGTCHLSPFKDSGSGGDNCFIKGGDFCANTEGLDHYKRFGYKGKLSSSRGESIDDDLKNNTSNNWITVKYKYNRGILHDGDFPHLSTPVTFIKPDYKRVILGFNCFTHEIGHLICRAPEHSDAYNRTIRLYQAMATAGQPVTDGSSTSYDAALNSGCSYCAIDADNISASSSVESASKKKISVNDIKKNPMLCKLLVAAARKIRENDVNKTGETRNSV